MVLLGSGVCGEFRSREPQLRNIVGIQATGSAFAAILDDGCVVTWGKPGAQKFYQAVLGLFP